MRKFALSNWLAGMTALAWCAFSAFWLGPYREPLIGFGASGYSKMMSFQLAVALAFVLLAHYKKRLLAGVLAAMALVFALPAPSKAGTLLRVENKTAAAKEVRLSRADDPQRRALLAVPVAQTVSYRTAPGDYSEGLQFVLENGARRLTTTVSELRKNKVVLSDTNIQLEEAITK